MGLIGGIFKGLRDAAVGKALQAAINSRIQFGNVRAMTLDSAAKTIDLRILLAGDPEDILITLHDYGIEEVEARWVLTIGRISSSREWVTRAAEQFAGRLSFTIPTEYGSLAEKLL